MANYQTHVTAGAGIGAVTAFIGMQLVPDTGWSVVALGSFLGFIGGTVPDLDHDHGKGLTKIMALLSTVLPVIVYGTWFAKKGDATGIVLAFLVPCHYLLYWALPQTALFSFKKKSRFKDAFLAILVAAICSVPALFFFTEMKLNWLQSWGVMVAGATIVQLSVPLLRWTTVHRGVWHTIPVAFIYAELMYLFLENFPQKARWVMTAAAFTGALSHLILDEIYSVDFDGMRIKKSFGTAFKLWDKNSPFWSGVIYLLMIGLGVVILVQ